MQQFYKGGRHQLWMVSIIGGLGGGFLAACSQDGSSGRQGHYSIDVPVAEYKIIDGTRSTEQDYPASGALLFKTRHWGMSLGSMLCSATLIAPDVAITAAHCDVHFFIDITEPVEYYFSLALDVSAFGDPFLSLPPKTVKVKRLLRHPGFDIDKVEPGLGESKDVALIFLEEPQASVRPVPLIRFYQSKALMVGAPVVIVGYGRRHNEATLSGDSGIKYHGWTKINAVGNYELQISSGSPEPHKCHGDSGGPTLMPFGEGSDQILALIGLTSHAFDWNDCWSGGVDTRVDPYLEWISASMKEACQDGTRPTCGR